MPVQVRCIFQGGGAKLATLIAAAEVVDEYEKAGKITVMEVAGTSAGSIAAYAVAHKEQISSLRAKMQRSGQSLISHFTAKRSRLGMLWNVARGNPIFPEHKLHSFLRATFTDSDSERPTLEDLRIPIHIRVSDIRNGSAHTYRAMGGVSMETALSDSCALPFAFRTFKSGSSFADGGITANLVDHSIFDVPSGNVIAFSFQRSRPNEIIDPVSFLMSLASTAIDASIHESRSKILEAGGYVCDLPNDFGTFDFEAALTRGLGKEYVDATKLYVRDQLDSALQHFKKSDRKLNFKGQTVQIQNMAWELLKRAEIERPYSLSLGAIVCIASGLDPASRNESSTVDKKIKEIHISAKSDSISAFHVGIARREAFELGNDIQWEITDNAGNLVAARHEVLETTHAGSPAWYSCFLLDEALGADRTPIKVRLITSHIGLMNGLLAGDTEWMRSVSSQDDTIATQDFILAYPKRSGSIVMSDLLASYHRASADLTDVEVMEKAWHTGRRMTESELGTYVKGLVTLDNYAYVGWRWNDVTPKAYTGVLIERTGRS